MSESMLDQSKMETFGNQLVGMLNYGAIALMTSIGHQTALFDTMSRLAPSTSHQIAQAAGLSERYVREWLGAMTVAGFIEHNPDNKTYSLPPEHAAFLTRAAGVNNLALQAQYIPMMAEVEQGIVNCFHNGGGVPYSKYARFQKLMAEDSGQVHDAALIDTILPLVPGLVARLEQGIAVLDVGCGQGHAVNLMASAFPNSRFTGYDFSQQGVESAEAESKARGLLNTHFEAKDVSTIDESGRYDLITAFDAIHDQAKPRAVLKAIHRALKLDGIFLMVDIRASSHVHENIDHPMGAFLYTISTMHCMTVSLALEGEGLGTVWGRQKALELLAEAGFSDVEVKEVEGDVFNYYYIVRR